MIFGRFDGIITSQKSAHYSQGDFLMSDEQSRSAFLSYARHLLNSCVAVLLALLAGTAVAEPAPVLIGFDGEFGYANSTSAEAISQGINIAIEEINRAGGVLGGRPLKLIEKANHSVPARSINNIKEFAATPDMVALFCGRFSPAVLESLPAINEAQIVLLDPWAAADAIVDNPGRPNFVFRLSLRDSWAMPMMLRYAQSNKHDHVGLLLLNTSWGRGNLKVAESFIARNRKLKLVGTHWFNWDEKSFLSKYQNLREAGASAIVLVSNADEAAILVREVAALPVEQRVPIIAHWGVTGGRMPALAGEALHQVDFSVVQTYSFIGARRPQAKKVIAAAKRLYGIQDARSIASPTGLAHAYDLTHLLSRAINRAGSTDRKAIRAALEQVRNYDGLIRNYAQPFTAERHEALSPGMLFMAKYAAEDDAIVRIWP